MQTLQTVRLTDSREWAVMTSPLSWPEAAERLAQGGGSAGFKVRDFPSASTNTAAGARTTNGEVRVLNVARQSPADRAGLQMGDIVLGVNGQPVKALEFAGQEPPASEIREHLKKVQEKKGAAPR